MSAERADCGEVAGEVMLRFLCPGDVDAVKQLCSDWFPIEYPHSWYQDITSSARFFSLAATYAGTIIGMIVAEIKHRTKVHREDADVLASSFPSDTQVTYILSLGVVKEFRSRGIGSLLLDSLMAHIEAATQDRCKAVYLHVLTTNAPAIRFYENRSFRQHHYLPCYYSIRGVLKDGFTYVLYLNGGHPPWTIVSLFKAIWGIFVFFDYMQYVGSALASLRPCSLPQRLLRHAQGLLRSLLPWRSLPDKPVTDYSRAL